jgi:hypothetical protein
MVWKIPSHWQPRLLLDVAFSVDTSTGATEVNTDAGRAFIKPMGNRQGPHVLATDWVGTHLANWFGLSTFEIAILRLTDGDVFPLPRNHRSQPGPAFAAKFLEGEAWGQSGKHLGKVVNLHDISRLVVFDTWTLNCDRYHYDLKVRKPNPDNIYLASEGVPRGKQSMIAMDHGLCFICSGEDLSPKLSNLNKVRDTNIYGLFPEFRRRLRQDIIEMSLARLKELDVSTVEEIVNSVPKEWDVSQGARSAWIELICRRADFVADSFEQSLEKICPWFDASGDHS